MATGATEPPADQKRRPRLLPDEPLQGAAARALHFATEALTREQSAAAAGEVEAVHQLRVATRRLRAIVELFSSIIHATRVKLWRRDLGWVATQAGAVRECDVIAEVIRDRARRIEPALADSLEPIYAALAARRKAQQVSLAAALLSSSYLTLIDRLGAPVFRKTPADSTLKSAADGLLRRIFRAVARAGASVAEDSTEEPLHRLRVRIKRLRYALETLTALDGKRRKKTVARLEELQELLGASNDMAVTVAYLHSYAASAGVPAKALLAAGALIQSLAGRRSKFTRRSLRALRRLERSAALGETPTASRARARTRLQADAATAKAA